MLVIAQKNLKTFEKFSIFKGFCICCKNQWVKINPVCVDQEKKAFCTKFEMLYFLMHSFK